MKVYRYVQGVATVFYIFWAYMLSSKGASGLILANILSMILRIIISLSYQYLNIFERNLGLFIKFYQKTFPNVFSLVGLFASFITLHYIWFLKFEENHLNVKISLIKIGLGGGKNTIFSFFLFIY